VLCCFGTYTDICGKSLNQTRPSKPYPTSCVIFRRSVFAFYPPHLSLNLVHSEFQRIMSMDMIPRTVGNLSALCFILYSPPLGVILHSLFPTCRPPLGADLLDLRQMTKMKDYDGFLQYCRVKRAQVRAGGWAE